MAANPNPELMYPTTYVIIDGDGHHSFTDEAELEDRIIDLVKTNEEITFKRSVHGDGINFPRFIIIEVS